MLQELSRTGSTSVVRLTGTALLWVAAALGLRATEPERWVVCYSNCPDALELADYQIVVLDGDQHPPLAPLIERNRTVLAYLSLTEMDQGRQIFPSLKAAGVVLERHPVWTDAHFLDFRHPEWSRTVLEHLVPKALDRGFTGLFLDTLDDAELLETRDPVRYKGMRAAAVRLVRAIRHHFPHIVLMVNRGYAIVPEIAPSIDLLLGESVIASFDPATKAYVRVPKADAEWQIDALGKAKSLNPRLRILTLDYWDPADTNEIRRLYAEQRGRGFLPYVSTPQLNGLVKEPR